MNVCKILSIKPDGKPWESQYGLMYPFYIVMEDGTAGTTNSKTETPPYKVGDTVGYDLNGSTPKGVPKLKITRNPKPGEGTPTGAGQGNPDLEAAPARQNPPQNRSISPAPTQTSSKGLEHYTGLYKACLGAAGNALHGTELEGDREALRQVATAFWIQGLRDGVQAGKDETNVPF